MPDRYSKLLEALERLPVLRLGQPSREELVVLACQLIEERDEALTRVKELEAEHQLRYGFETRLKRAEAVVEAAKEVEFNWDVIVQAGLKPDRLCDAIRRYEEER